MGPDQTSPMNTHATLASSVTSVHSNALAVSARATLSQFAMVKATVSSVKMAPLHASVCLASLDASATSFALVTRHTWERHAAIVAPWIHTQTLPAVVLTVEPVCVMMKRCPMVLAVSARSHLLARPATLHAQCSRARSAEATVNASSRPLARFLLAFASAMSALLDPTVRASAHATPRLLRVVPTLMRLMAMSALATEPVVSQRTTGPNVPVMKDGLPTIVSTASAAHPTVSSTRRLRSVPVLLVRCAVRRRQSDLLRR